jgi:hypothetical protein
MALVSDITNAFVCLVRDVKIIVDKFRNMQIFRVKVKAKFVDNSQFPSLSYENNSSLMTVSFLPVNSGSRVSASRKVLLVGQSKGGVIICGTP